MHYQVPRAMVRQFAQLALSMKFMGWQIAILRGSLPASSTMTLRRPIHSTKNNDTLMYQLCSAAFDQRHKRHLVNASTDLFEIALNPFSFPTLLAKAESGRGGPVRESGGRFGRLDAANESGMFHKINKAKLAKIKKFFKDKPIAKEGTADPAKPDDSK